MSGEKGKGQMYGTDGMNNLLRFAVRGGCLPNCSVFLEKRSQLYNRNEWFVVDVNLDADDEIVKPFCDPLLSCVGVGTVLRIGSTLYALGYDLYPPYRICDALRVPTGETIGCLKGLSWIDLNDNTDNSWKHGASPQIYDSGLEYAALDGKIYSLPSYKLHKTCVYLPHQDRWVPTYSPIPRRFHHHMISKYLISDPANKRILVHLHDGTGEFTLRTPSAIYMWSPQVHSQPDPDRARFSRCKNWECVQPQFSTHSWQKKALLVDGMLLFYYRKSAHLFSALDLKSNKWFDSKWSNEYPSDQWYKKAKSMFYLGNNRICLCMSLPLRAPVYGAGIQFFVFEFHRSPAAPHDGVVKPTITFTFLFMKTFYAEHIDEVIDFVPLGI